VQATRDDLVGQYVGHTAPKTKEILQKAIGGVLFIDEAYYLYRAENERDYGQEAIEILLQFMENRRDDLVVILAGYKDRMNTFFQSNPGLHSRIAHHIEFPDYTVEELMAIAKLMARQQMYTFDEAAGRAFQEYLEMRIHQPHFANGRSVRNAIDRIKLRQAIRIVERGGRIEKDELARIDAVDILQSRVFQGGLDTDGKPDGDTRCLSKT
jgi:probable Rubsico expression protein CbbX